MLNKPIIEEHARQYVAWMQCHEKKAWSREQMLFSRHFASKVRGRGFLLHDQRRGLDSEFLMIVAWKAVRQTGNARVNDNTRVRKATQQAFKLASDCQIVEAVKTLASLLGVGVRMASAMLAVYDPKQFTVLDELAWIALKRESMLCRSTDSDLDKPLFYEEYLYICRNLAHEYGVSLRTLDRCLWWNGKNLKDAGNKRCF